MKRTKRELSRRAFLTSMGILGVAGHIRHGRASAVSRPVLKKAIPTTGERLPVIGMGSSRTFNVGDDIVLRDRRVEVLRTFFDAGGAVIDSSPMYLSSEAVIGYCLERIAGKDALFSATKVWTPFQWLGIRQMMASSTIGSPRRRPPRARCPCPRESPKRLPSRAWAG